MSAWIGCVLRWWRRSTGQCHEKRRSKQLADRRPLERLLDRVQR